MQNAIAKKPNTDIAKSPCRSIWKSCDSKLKQYTLHLYTSEMGVFSPGTLTKSKLVGLRNSSSWFQLVFPTFLKIKNVFGVQIHFLFSQTPPQKKKTPKTACLRPTGNHDFDQAAAAPTYQRLRPRRRPVDATPGHRRGESGRPGSFPLHLSEENNEIMEICERGQVNNNLEIEVDQKVKVVFKQN